MDAAAATQAGTERDPAWETLVAGGLSWQVAPALRERLRSTPADIWQNPDGQPGWQRVKDNGHRSVWRIEWAGLTCYAKYYRDDGWRDRLRRLFRAPACAIELRSGRFVQAAGINAARPLACCAKLTFAGRPHALLISAAIEEAVPLSDAWLALREIRPSLRPRRVEQIREALAALIAHAHQAGFEHLDMHAGNLLVQNSGEEVRVHFVDLQSAHLDQSVDDHAVVRNLAQLNQWFRRHSDVRVRLAFLRAYLRWRNHYEPRTAHGRLLGLSYRQLVAHLVRQADTHADRLWAQRDRRLARRGRYYAPLRLGGGWHARVVRGWKHARADSEVSTRAFPLEWWRTALDPDALLALVEGGNLKDSHSAAVARAELAHPDGPLPVVLKQPRARDWRRRLRHALMPSRSLLNWRTGQMLLHRELPAAAPLAVLEQRAGPFIRTSLLVTEFLPEAEALPRHLTTARAERSPRVWHRYRQRLARALAGQVRHLHERGFRHRDCKADNILVLPGRDPRLLWIDLDGIRRVAPPPLDPQGPRRASRAAQLTALTRLHVSLADHPAITRSDRARVLRHYFAGFGRDPRAWRSAWREIDRRAAAQQQRRARRRAWKQEQYGRA